LRFLASLSLNSLSFYLFNFNISYTNLEAVSKYISYFIPLPKKLLTIFTLSPKLTNGESDESGENVKVVKMSDLFCFLV